MMDAFPKTTTDIEDFGVMTDEWKEGTPTYNLKELFEYCHKVKKKPIELAEEEREQFRTN